MSTVAFVAGATGLTGRYVVEACRARGWTTHAHVRPDSQSLPQWREQFEAMGAEVDTTQWEPVALSQTLAAKKPTVVFALLGTTRKRGRRSGGRDTYDTVDYGLSALLMDACVGAGLRPRYVYLSALGTHPGQTHGYYGARSRMEAKLAAGTLPYVIGRPSLIVGNRDEPRLGETMAHQLLEAASVIAKSIGLSGLAERYGSISGPDLARGLVAAAAGANEEHMVLDAAALRRLAAS